jgi:hypothetical protein
LVSLEPPDKRIGPAVREGQENNALLSDTGEGCREKRVKQSRREAGTGHDLKARKERLEERITCPLFSNCWM